MTREGRDRSTRDELLDHDVDGIREFDNALPRWWLYGFYFTIVWAAVYVVNYHVLARPLVGHPGMVAEYQAEMAAASHLAAARPSGAGAAPSTALVDAESLAKGRAIFESAENACGSCHRNDLGGLVGPNLTDDYWLHGCSVGAIAENIKTGFPQKGMLPYGVGKTLSDQQLHQLASYVLSKRGSQAASPKPIDPERDTVCR